MNREGFTVVCFKDSCDMENMKGKTDLIVVLGSPNADDGRLYDVAIGRCELALEVYRENPEQRVILTGGFGEHFNLSSQPHSRLLEDYLLEQGLPENAIAGHVESANSIEDALLSKDLIASLNPGVVTIVTSDYHQERAEFIFRNVWGDAIDLRFRYSPANPDTSELDIRELAAHEKRAVEKLRCVGLEGYYR